MLLIGEMCALSFVARTYYRRHMDIPADDRLFSTGIGIDTMADSFLHTHANSNSYGAMSTTCTTTSTGNTRGIDADEELPVVLLNRREGDRNQKVALSRDYRVHDEDGINRAAVDNDASLNVAVDVHTHNDIPVRHE